MKKKKERKKRKEKKGKKKRRASQQHLSSKRLHLREMNNPSSTMDRNLTQGRIEWWRLISSTSQVVRYATCETNHARAGIPRERSRKIDDDQKSCRYRRPFPSLSSLLREAREFTFRRISAGETDSSAGHVRPARRPRKGNGRSRNFNDHPSRSTANFSCARNSSILEARLAALLGRGETGVDFPAIECRLD